MAELTQPTLYVPNNQAVPSGDGRPSLPWSGFFDALERRVPTLEVDDAGVLLGRGTADGGGEVQEITLGSGISMSGTELSATGLGGDVVGPSSATDNALAAWDGATGKLLKDTTVLASWFNQSLLTSNSPTFGGLTAMGATSTLIQSLASTTTSAATVSAACGSVGGFMRAYGSAFAVASLASTLGVGPDGASGIVIFSNATSPSGGSGSISLRGGGYDSGAEKVFIDQNGTVITGTITIPNTGLLLRDTNASHTLGIVPGSDLTANRTLTVTTGDASRTLTLEGNPTISDWFDQNVKTSASPSFNGLTLTSLSVNGFTVTVNGAPTLNDWFDQSVKQAASPTFSALTVTNAASANALTVTTSVSADTVSATTGIDAPLFSAGLDNGVTEGPYTLALDGGGTVTIQVKGGIVIALS